MHPTSDDAPSNSLTRARQRDMSGMSRRAEPMGYAGLVNGVSTGTSSRSVQVNGSVSPTCR
jgi:hypothetical protein